MVSTRRAAAIRSGPRRTRARQRLEGLEQVRALSHPLRIELLELFAERPRTTMQAAEAMNRPPTRLYHHVAKLEQAGLIRLRETRPNRGTIEKYYEVTARAFVDGAETRQALQGAGEKDQAAIGLVVFDRARNELVRALAQSRTDTLVAVRLLLRVSPGGARRVRQRLVQLVKELTPGRPPAAPTRRRSGATLGRYALTLALVPLDPSG